METGRLNGHFSTSDLGLAAFLRMPSIDALALQDGLAAVDVLDECAEGDDVASALATIRDVLGSLLDRCDGRLRLRGATRHGRGKFDFSFDDPEGLSAGLQVVYSESCCHLHDDSVRHLRSMAQG